MKKKCTKCLEVKLLTEFTGNLGCNDGLQSWCKKCTKKCVKEWGKNNPELLSESRRRSNEKRKNSITIRNEVRYASRFLRKYIPSGIGKTWHHWSYLDEYSKNVILLSDKDHRHIEAKVKGLIYRNKDEYFWRNKETGELLDTREKHTALLRKHKIHIHAELQL